MKIENYGLSNVQVYLEGTIYRIDYLLNEDLMGNFVEQQV